MLNRSKVVKSDGLSRSFVEDGDEMLTLQLTKIVGAT